jgi:hypothetical protein
MRTCLVWDKTKQNKKSWGGGGGGRGESLERVDFVFVVLEIFRLVGYFPVFHFVL